MLSRILCHLQLLTSFLFIIFLCLGDILLTLDQWPLYVKVDNTRTGASHVATIQQQIIASSLPRVLRFYRSTKIRSRWVGYFTCP